MAALDKRPVPLSEKLVLPFEQLQNLPKPVVTTIDLGITLKDASATRNLEPSITDVRRVGYFSSDQTTQTDNSDILELKFVTGTIGSIIEDISKLRDELSYTKHVMRGDYENQIDQRAAELYSEANEKVKELEAIHTEKIETIRKSYRTQLSNAISKIAGEYKVYYDQVLQGKTGHHDSRIRELKQRVEILEHYLTESEAEIKSLKDTLDFQNMKTEELRGIRWSLKKAITHKSCPASSHARNKASHFYHPSTHRRPSISSTKTSPVPPMALASELDSKQSRSYQYPSTSHTHRYPSISSTKTSPVPPMALASELDLEKEQELRNSISLLETELSQVQNELASKEDESTKFKKLSESLNKQLEEEKGKVSRLKKDMEVIKKKNTEEKQKAERIAQGQRDALEREMKQKMENSEQEAQKQAEEKAEMQRMKDVAHFQQEIEKRKSLEDELRAKASEVVPSVVPDSELSKELESLRRLSTKQSQEVVRLTKEMDSCNRINETKLAIMQRNFHALKDESYVRRSFERQASVLHYATVGYASTNPSNYPYKQPMKTHHGGRNLHSRLKGMTATPNGPPVPTPTPVHHYTRCSEDELEELPIAGHFMGENNTHIPMQA